MDHKNHDKAFFKNFSFVMGTLFAIFFICIAIARMITPAAQHDEAALARIEERIKPIGEVVTDPAALQAKLAANKPVRSPYTGEQVVAKICSACHLSGMLGAPKIGDKGAWGGRKSAVGGIDGLVASAIKGKNQMPSRGGDPDLNDAEIKAAIEFMLGK